MSPFKSNRNYCVKAVTYFLAFDLREYFLMSVLHLKTKHYRVLQYLLTIYIGVCTGSLPSSITRVLFFACD